MYDIVKFERGQVWMVRFKHQESVGREQDKDRPYLVLSVGRFNKSSGMITAVPITTRDNTYTPAQVRFINDRGKSNVILCEQIRSFDYQSGNYIFDFMGIISDEILEKVDVALSIHLGLHYSPITLKKLHDSMEAIIQSVGYMQRIADTPKFTDADVLEFADKLQEIAENRAKKEVAATTESTYPRYVDCLEEISTTREEPEDTPETPTPSAGEPEEDTPKKAPRIRWTREKCEEFMNDSNTLPMKKVMEKWNILKKPRYYSMRNYVLAQLEKMK